MILAFTGKMGSGKTTVCNHLMEVREFKKVNFKDAIVDELKQNFGPLLEEIIALGGLSVPLVQATVDDLFKEKPPLMRKLMQCYGTEVRRNDDPNYWIKKWKEKVTYTKEDVLCDDVRFLNEVEAIKDMGGVVIRIVREDIVDTGTHQSEAEMDLIVPDFTVTAVKDDLEGLFKQIDEIVESVDKPLSSIVN